MAEAAKKALEVDKFKVVADAGYSTENRSLTAKRLAWFRTFLSYAQ